MMPVPKPNSGETKEDFIARCMGNDTMKTEFPDNDQRLAVCYNQWEDRSAPVASVDEYRQKRSAHIRQCRVRRYNFDIKHLEERAAGDGLPDIIGHAAVFDTPAEIWPGVRESIAPGAFARSLEEKTDVRALRDHDASMLLGRTSAGTLALKEDKIGLYCRISPPDTSTGRDTVELMRRGDLNQMSFAFYIRSEQADYTDEGAHYRLLDVDLLDVSVVTFPAYEEAIVSLEEFEAERQRAKPGIEPQKAVGVLTSDTLRRRARIQDLMRFK